MDKKLLLLRKKLSSKESIVFYVIYGVLQSSVYKGRFQINLSNERGEK